MQIETENMLRRIGDQLDQNIFPTAMDSGIITLSDSDVPTSAMSEEDQHYDREEKRRPTTNSWQRPAGWQGKAYKATSLISTDLKENYENQLDSVTQAFPGAEVWVQPEGVWLVTKSKLLLGLSEHAVFVTAIPFSPLVRVRSWGFWENVLGDSWIGPRHTNFPDGSICAFEPRDKTWVHGGSLVGLLDLYTLWAVRHLYLRTFRRWPGTQSVEHVAERLLELKSDECCGCGSIKKYNKCCQRKDLSLNRSVEVASFLRLNSFNIIRNPPKEVVNFAKNRKDPPNI